MAEKINFDSEFTNVILPDCITGEAGGPWIKSGWSSVSACCVVMMAAFLRRPNTGFAGHACIMFDSKTLTKERLPAIPMTVETFEDVAEAMCAAHTGELASGDTRNFQGLLGVVMVEHPPQADETGFVTVSYSPDPEVPDTVTHVFTRREIGKFALGYQANEFDLGNIPLFSDRLPLPDSLSTVYTSADFVCDGDELVLVEAA